jgi:hypothetical protein
VPHPSRFLRRVGFHDCSMLGISRRRHACPLPLTLKRGGASRPARFCIRLPKPLSFRRASEARQEESAVPPVPARLPQS